MTDRAVFGRRYTSFTPGATEVFLLNGTAVSLSAASTQEFTAGSTLLQGETVHVSGTFVLPASAASGVLSAQYRAIGVTAAAASSSTPVTVILDDIAVVSDVNITADATLIPGEYYFLSKFPGQITRFTTASGEATISGGYAALTTVGQALSSTELKIEIEAPIVLTS